MTEWQAFEAMGGELSGGLLRTSGLGDPVTADVMGMALSNDG